MKTDNYKNLCLEQALLSPLKYRHGSIVVKGGKVIGHGFNDYRRGYDGGALKTGQLPIAAHKQKPSSKSAGSGGGFTAFEAVAGMGGSHFANTPLTMHGEMMAINSALASSSTLAASTVSCIKPCFKLPGDTKRRRELRRGAVAAYVERTCRQEVEQGQQQQQQQQGAAPVQGQEWRFEAPAHRCYGAPGRDQDEEWSSSSEPESEPEETWLE
jgi:deoxycytidylate deaminase